MVDYEKTIRDSYRGTGYGYDKDRNYRGEVYNTPKVYRYTSSYSFVFDCVSIINMSDYCETYELSYYKFVTLKLKDYLMLKSIAEPNKIDLVFNITSSGHTLTRIFIQYKNSSLDFVVDINNCNGLSDIYNNIDTWFNSFTNINKYHKAIVDCKEIR